jgi:hypothetical protein
MPPSWLGASEFQPPAFDDIEDANQIYNTALTTRRGLQRKTSRPGERQLSINSSHPLKTPSPPQPPLQPLPRSLVRAPARERRRQQGRPDPHRSPPALRAAQKPRQIIDRGVQPLEEAPPREPVAVHHALVRARSADAADVHLVPCEIEQRAESYVAHVKAAAPSGAGRDRRENPRARRRSCAPVRRRRLHGCARSGRSIRLGQSRCWSGGRGRSGRNQAGSWSLCSPSVPIRLARFCGRAIGSRL